MSWSWRWPPWRSAPDTTDEALEQLHRLTCQDAEVARLARQLRETRRRNNFSTMVDAAISRRVREEGT
jgi:hypothetical protein